MKLALKSAGVEKLFNLLPTAFPKQKDYQQLSIVGSLCSSDGHRKSNEKEISTLFCFEGTRRPETYQFQLFQLEMSVEIFAEINPI